LGEKNSLAVTTNQKVGEITLMFNKKQRFLDKMHFGG
jgi:hypothetical protein